MCKSALFDELYIATDDKRIREIVVGFAPMHYDIFPMSSGTERIAEAIELGNIK